MHKMHKGPSQPDMKRILESTYNPKVLSAVGDYAGLFNFGESILVSSTDGIGTKLFLAQTPEEHESVGADLVNHCVNDILVTGATPLFFLNYFGYSLDQAKDLQVPVTAGMAKAAREVNMPIISGETACMDGFYAGPDGLYDLVGTIVGIVRHDELLDGAKVCPGDVLIGVPSAGLHTNGFTLLRKIFNHHSSSPVNKDKWLYCDKLGMGVREAALRPHRCYLNLVKPMMKRFNIKAIAHITGGGIEANINRVLNGHTVEIRWGGWEIPAFFQLIQQAGKMSDEVMRSTYNLGIGLVIVVASKDANATLGYLDIMGEKPTVVGIVGSTVS